MAMLEMMLRVLLLLCMMNVIVTSGEDRIHMRAALRLAEQALGVTSPNPCVGCIIVAPNGTVIGRGWHRKAGGPHAEANALAEVDHSAINCTAYVTLEPCNHFGKTPPCSRALVRAGIKRVVAGTVDPDPRVSGKGIAYLRENGVQVDIMDGKENLMCQVANTPFIHRVLNNKPYLYHMSLSLAALKRIYQTDAARLLSLLSPIKERLARMDTIVLDANVTRHFFNLKLKTGILPVSYLHKLFSTRQLSSIVVCVDSKDINAEFVKFVSDLSPKAVFFQGQTESVPEEVPLFSSKLAVWYQGSEAVSSIPSVREYICRRCGLEFGSNGIIWIDFSPSNTNNLLKRYRKAKQLFHAAQELVGDGAEVSFDLFKRKGKLSLGKETIMQAGRDGVLFVNPLDVLAKAKKVKKSKVKQRSPHGSNDDENENENGVQSHLSIRLNHQRKLVWKNRIFWLPYDHKPSDGLAVSSMKLELSGDQPW